jgi:hypothetical protein
LYQLPPGAGGNSTPVREPSEEEWRVIEEAYQELLVDRSGIMLDPLVTCSWS